MSTKLSLVVAFGWLAICAVIIGLFTGINLDLNFFTWRGEWRAQGISCALGIAILLMVLHFLTRYTVGSIAFTFAIIASLSLIGYALYEIAPEPPLNRGQWFSRDTPSPGWYRFGRLAIASIPLGTLICRISGRRNREKRKNHE